MQFEVFETSKLRTIPGIVAMRTQGMIAGDYLEIFCKQLTFFQCRGFLPKRHTGIKTGFQHIAIRYVRAKDLSILHGETQDPCLKIHIPNVPGEFYPQSNIGYGWKGEIIKRIGSSIRDIAEAWLIPILRKQSDLTVDLHLVGRVQELR